MSEQALWQRLALSRDRLCASRFLGSFSPEARQVVTTEDPRPYLSTARFVPGADGDVGTIDWKEVGVNGGGGLCCLWVCCLMFDVLEILCCFGPCLVIVGTIHVVALILE